ncbi:MAG: polysaccharide deacetylase family protein [Candidatus Omnitrophota bacterium]
MLKRLLIVILLVILVFFLALGIISCNYVAPILMYHSINLKVPFGNRMVVSVKSFERQMRFLKDHRYNVVPLETLADLVREQKKIPPKTVAITFDDGYKDNYTLAFPVLKKYNLCATIFVILDEIDRPQGDRLSWQDLFAMRDSGLMTIGSHCLGPEPLINSKSEEEIKRQITESKRILEERLGRGIYAFSYPEGRFTPQIKQWVREAGYKFAVVTNPGKKFPNDDVLALKRLRISDTSDSLFVFWVESSGYYNFIREHRRK